MAESAPVRDPCIISWQSRINNTARNAKCWVLASPTRTLNRCNPRLAVLPFCSTKSRGPRRATGVWKLCLIILLCATSPQNAPTLAGPHDNRLVGDTEKGSETLVRADTSVADSGEMAGRTTHQLQDTERERERDPPSLYPTTHALLRLCRLMVVNSGRDWTLLLGRACYHVKPIKGHKYTVKIVNCWHGRTSEVEAKEPFFFKIRSPDCLVVHMRTG